MNSVDDRPDVKSLPAYVSFLGNRASSSGYTATTEIRYEQQDSKGWPYLTVFITSAEGGLVFQSSEYAAWFSTILCWDEMERLWIKSSDSGVDVIAMTPDGWQQHRWMEGEGCKKMLDAQTGKALEVVSWGLPEALQK